MILKLKELISRHRDEDAKKLVELSDAEIERLVNTREETGIPVAQMISLKVEGYEVRRMRAKEEVKLPNRQLQEELSISLPIQVGIKNAGYCIYLYE